MRSELPRVILKSYYSLTEEWRGEFTGSTTSLILPASLDAVFKRHQQGIHVLETFELGLVDSVDYRSNNQADMSFTVDKDGQDLETYGSSGVN